jgi:hypothetical protein
MSLLSRLQNELRFISEVLVVTRSWGSSVSIVSNYIQTGRLGFDPWQGQRIFLLASASRSGTHLAFYPVGAGGPFPGVKRGRGVTLTI